MRDWKCGRKPATPEQLKQSKERQKQRVKITNIIARETNLERKCCICGKDNAEILHNTENPYFITFLCRQCRKNKDNIKEAKLHRFDLEAYRRDKLDNRDNNIYMNTHKFAKKEIKDIIDGFIEPSNTLTMGEYANGLGLSRYQFNCIIKRYDEYFPDSKIEERIGIHNKFIDNFVNKCSDYQKEINNLGDKRNIVGGNIKKYRIAKNLTGKEVRKRLYLQGVKMPQNAIARIEEYKRGINDIELDAIAKILNITISDLFETN